jgi:hypothetical protein
LDQLVKVLLPYGKQHILHLVTPINVSEHPSRGTRWPPLRLTLPVAIPFLSLKGLLLYTRASEQKINVWHKVSNQYKKLNGRTRVGRALRLCDV